MPQNRKLRARYRTVGPKKAQVTYRKAWIDDETKSLQSEEVTEEMNTWMVYFPAGHSIRFCGDAGFKELKRGGFHLRPRLVDMDTGDVVDSGGDPYDFGEEGNASDNDVVLQPEDDADDIPSRRRTSSSTKG